MGRVSVRVFPHPLSRLLTTSVRHVEVVAVYKGRLRNWTKRGSDSRTCFGRELASFLNEIPEGGRRPFERTIGFDLHFANVGLAGDVSRHAWCLARY